MQQPLSFSQFWESYPWYMHAYWIITISFTILYIGERILFRKRTGHLVDVVCSLLAACALLRLVWNSWVHSLIIAAAMILLSEACADFKVFLSSKKQLVNQIKERENKDKNIK